MSKKVTAVLAFVMLFIMLFSELPLLETGAFAITEYNNSMLTKSGTESVLAWNNILTDDQIEKIIKEAKALKETYTFVDPKDKKTKTYQGRCSEFVIDSCANAGMSRKIVKNGIDVVDGDWGNSDAIDLFNRAFNDGQLHTDKNPPRGAFVYWAWDATKSDDKKLYGKNGKELPKSKAWSHIALSLGKYDKNDKPSDSYYVISGGGSTGTITTFKSMCGKTSGTGKIMKGGELKDAPYVYLGWSWPIGYTYEPTEVATNLTVELGSSSYVYSQPSSSADKASSKALPGGTEGTADRIVKEGEDWWYHVTIAGCEGYVNSKSIASVSLGAKAIEVKSSISLTTWKATDQAVSFKQTVNAKNCGLNKITGTILNSAGETAKNKKGVAQSATEKLTGTETSVSLVGTAIDKNLSPKRISSAGVYQYVLTADVSAFVVQDNKCKLNKFKDVKIYSDRFEVYSKSATTVCVTLDPNGGSLYDKERLVKKDTAIGTLPTPSCVGKKFDGWYTEKTGGTKVTESTVVSSKMTLYAHWSDASTKGKIAVTFSNWSGPSAGTNVVYVDSGQKVARPANPTCTGYAFVDWYTDKALKTKYDFNSKVTKALTLYGKWEVKQPTADEYMQLCLKKATPVETSITVRVNNNDTWLKSLPCSQDTNVNSKTLCKLKEGATYTVTKIYMNTAGNYWYYFPSADGYAGYTYAGSTDLVGRAGSGYVSFSGTDLTDDHDSGTSRHLSGTVKAKSGAFLTGVSTKLTDADGKSQTTSCSLSKKPASYDVHGDCKDLCYALKFKELAVGDCRYTLTAKYAFYYSDGKELLTSSTYTESRESTFTVVKSFKITYNANGGQGAPKEQSGKNGKTITLRSDIPTRDGYTFLGWSTSKNATAASYKAGDEYTVGTKDVTLYAVWEKKAETLYTVTYNANGGQGAPDAQKAASGQTVTIPDKVPTRDGYTFLGWSTSQSATAPSYKAKDKYTVGTKDVTLYAVWEKKAETQYTVTYNANGGQGAPDAQRAASGKTVTIPDKVPTRDGYTFLGWSTSKNAAAASYKAGDTYTVGTKDETLYAVWEKKAETQYTVTYNANGGQGAPDAQKAASGQTVTIPDKVPTRDGYTFLGWSTSKSATAASYKAKDTYTVGTSNVTLYAVWEKKAETQYTVTYNANGGQGAPDAQTVTGNRFTVSSTIPVREYSSSPQETVYYTFLGWATVENAESPEYYAGQTYDIRSDLTLYSVWRSDFNTVLHLVAPKGVNRVTEYAEKNYTYVLIYATAHNDKTFSELGWPLYDEANWPMNTSSYDKEYILEGWYTEEEGKGTRITADTVVDHSFRISPYWVEKPADIEISSVELSTVFGAIGDPLPTVVSTSTPGVEAAIQWCYNEDGLPPASGNILANKRYLAVVTLSAKSGYVFPGGEISVTMNGVQDYYGNDGQSNTVTTYWPFSTTAYDPQNIRTEEELRMAITDRATDIITTGDFHITSDLEIPNYYEYYNHGPITIRSNVTVDAGAKLSNNGTVNIGSGFLIMSEGSSLYLGSVDGHPMDISLEGGGIIDNGTALSGDGRIVIYADICSEEVIAASADSFGKEKLYYVVTATSPEELAAYTAAAEPYRMYDIGIWEEGLFELTQDISVPSNYNVLFHTTVNIALAQDRTLENHGYIQLSDGSFFSISNGANFTSAGDMGLGEDVHIAIQNGGTFINYGSIYLDVDDSVQTSNTVILDNSESVFQNDGYIDPRVRIISYKPRFVYTEEELRMAIEDRAPVVVASGEFAITEDLEIPGFYVDGCSVQIAGRVSVAPGVTLTNRGTVVLTRSGTLTLQSGATLKMPTPSASLNMAGGQLINDGGTIDIVESAWVFVYANEYDAAQLAIIGNLFGVEKITVDSYAASVSELEALLELGDTAYRNVRVTTVDGFQGGEFTKDFVVRKNTDLLLNGMTLSIQGKTNFINYGQIFSLGGSKSTVFVKSEGLYQNYGYIDSSVQVITYDPMNIRTEQELRYALSNNDWLVGVCADVTITEDLVIPECYGGNANLFIEGTVSIDSGVTVTNMGRVYMDGALTLQSGATLNMPTAQSAVIMQGGKVINNGGTVALSNGAWVQVAGDRYSASDITEITAVFGAGNISLVMYPLTADELSATAAMGDLGYREISILVSPELLAGGSFPDLTIRANSHLVFYDGVDAVIPAGSTFINNGDIWYNGKLTVPAGMTFINNGAIEHTGGVEDSVLFIADGASFTNNGYVETEISIQYESYYTVTWKNYDGTVLETDENVAPGATPSYDGATPIKPDDELHTYTFSGWSPAVSAVSGNVEYTAQYTEAQRVELKQAETKPTDSEMSKVKKPETEPSEAKQTQTEPPVEGIDT